MAPRQSLRRVFAVGALLVQTAVPAQAPATAPAAAPAQMTAEQRIDAVKQSFVASQRVLRGYEWIETTTVFVDGDQKSQKVDRCYYGMDGGLQRVPVSQSAPPKKKGGIRGAIQSGAQEDMQNYIKQSIALVKSYLPPDPALLQRAKAAGKVSVDMLQPGKVIRLVFKDYKIPGDFFAVTMDVTTNKLMGVNIGSYIDKPSDTVTLDVAMGQFPDGTIFTRETVLNAKAKDVKVAVTNSGYKKNG